MSKQKILLVLILFLFGVGCVVLYQYLREENAKNSSNVTPPLAQEGCDQSTTTQDCKPISLATSTWKVFENTKYGYAISYPLEGDISTGFDYAGNAMKDVILGIPGRFTLGGVDATMYSDFPNLRTMYSDFPSDLKLYAEAVRNLQVNDPNPYVKGRKIGELKETVVDGRKAYQFIITKGFIASTAEYAIPDGEVYMYTVTENSRGQKIIIYYFLGNPIAEKMYQTFVFK